MPQGSSVVRPTNGLYLTFYRQQKNKPFFTEYYYCSMAQYNIGKHRVILSLEREIAHSEWNSTSKGAMNGITTKY